MLTPPALTPPHHHHPTHVLHYLVQYLDDHLHLPTIKKLPRTMPIVANPEAAGIVKGLGFSNVTVVDHGQTVEVANGRLRITATAGGWCGVVWSGVAWVAWVGWLRWRMGR